jgi:hypothetical protein
LFNLKKKKMRKLSLYFLALIAVLAFACGGDTDTPTPTPTETEEPAGGLSVEGKSDADVDADACEKGEDEFRIVLHLENAQPEGTVIYIAGTLAGEWAEPGTNPDFEMTRIDEKTYCVTIWKGGLNDEASNYEFKFFKNAGWGVGTERCGEDDSQRNIIAPWSFNNLPENVVVSNHEFEDECDEDEE